MEIAHNIEGTPARKVEDYLLDVSYREYVNYIPSNFSLEFINFIKLVNGTVGEEHETPVFHYKMLDELVGSEKHICNMCARGTAKTTLLGEYLFLYLALYGELEGFNINYALYVGDSIENNVKKMRLRLERRWENSEFLKQFIPKVRFTDIRWYFKNSSGREFVVTGHGAKTGVRGTVELNTRPQLAVLDDLISDEDARSDTVIASIEETVYKAIDYALHPTKNKIIWSGTPFNAKDPLYKAVESGAWAVNVYPICEEFPCEKEDFQGAWEDRFTYEYVKDKYIKAKQAGKIDTFNQELMLRIMSDEDRLIEDQDIIWYDRNNVIQNKGAYNFYITTDFATTEKSSGDFSVISVWAYNNNGDWMWVDGICKRQTMDKNVDDLFILAQRYSPQSVGIEVTGQQQGFVSWIQTEMISRNIFFNLASDNQVSDAAGLKKAGIRPNTNKMQRFNIVVPWFKMHKIWFPEDMKGSNIMVEAMNELTLVSMNGMRSKHDDFLDTISQLASLKAWKPSEVTPKPAESTPARYWLDEVSDSEEEEMLDRYVV
jgi:phage terminase large subunit-like protein